jgi:hypothetical protein
VVTDEDRCPSFGIALGGEKVSTRYKGNLTVIRFRVPPEDPEGEPTELEHVCGD